MSSECNSSLGSNEDAAVEAHDSSESASVGSMMTIAEAADEVQFIRVKRRTKHPTVSAICSTHSFSPTPTTLQRHVQGFAQKKMKKFFATKRPFQDLNLSFNEGPVGCVAKPKKRTNNDTQKYLCDAR
jgi:hypothetical protein